MTAITLKKKYRAGKSYKNQNSTKSISGSSSKKGRNTGAKHKNQKDMILVVRPGFRKMMTVDEHKEFVKLESND